MKSRLSLLLLFITAFTFAQTWQLSSLPPNNSGQRFDDVYFLNEDLGWAANGYYAAVYKTTDGGLNWKEQISEEDLGENLYFRNIEFLNENIGFLGTLNGKFFRTADGGDSWTIMDINPNPPAICGISAVGESAVYACGAYFNPAYVIKSLDQGETWEYIDMSAYAIALVEVKFVNEETGYVSGYDEDGACILKTIDGGISWNEIYNSGKNGQYVWKLQILDEGNSTIFGSVESNYPNPGLLIKSFDSGNTWTELEAPENEIQAVGFVTATHGWMGGHNTGFYETLDGGESWTSLGIGSNLNRIFIINEELAYAAGTSVYKYTDKSLGISSENAAMSKKLNIQILQNPIDSDLELSIDFDSPDNVLIDLFSIEGKLIKTLYRSSISVPGKMNYLFNVAELSSGMYFVSIHNNFNRQTFNFIKE